MIIWRKSMDLTVAVYRLTATFPSNERYNLTDQIRRSATSIPANIAEGFRRFSPREWQRFIRIAFGSAGELESHLILAKRLELVPLDEFKNSDVILQETLKLLNSVCIGFRNL